MTRSLPAGLAPIVSDLELEQPVIVTLDQIADLAESNSIATLPRIVAKRLRDTGWLLATEIAGVYEFAPGAHAGPIGHGDPFITVRAAVARYTNLEPVVVGVAAMWAQGFVDRLGAVDIAVAPGIPIPAAVGRALGVTRFRPALSPERSRGVSVVSPTSVLVHAATHPLTIGWGDARDGLQELMESITTDDLDVELADRSNATAARTAYLLSGVRPDLANHVELRLTRDRVWFGPHGAVLRYAPRFGIADTTLPFDPVTLDTEEPR